MRAWPSGIAQELTNLAPKQFLTIKEPSRLKAEYLQASAGLSLTVIGWAGPAYSLESSIDFMTWVSVVSLNQSNWQDRLDQSAVRPRAIKILSRARIVNPRRTDSSGGESTLSADSQPFQARFLATGRNLIVITNPILIGEFFPQRIGLSCEDVDGFLALQEVVEPLSNGLACGSVRAVWIRHLQGHALDTDANKLTEQRLSCGCVPKSPTEVHHHLERVLPGVLITGLLV